MLQKEIKGAVMTALKERNSQKADVLRMLVSAFTNELVSKGKKPQDELNDEEALAVIVRIAKQRKDSIDQYEKAGREDLANEEKSQLAYLASYLPQLMSEEEIKAYIQKKVEGGLDLSQKGIVMKEIMTDLKGKVDGMLVKKIIDNF